MLGSDITSFDVSSIHATQFWVSEQDAFEVFRL